jgi:hypothetical protein
MEGAMALANGKCGIWVGLGALLALGCGSESGPGDTGSDVADGNPCPSIRPGEGQACEGAMTCSYPLGYCASSHSYLYEVCDCTGGVSWACDPQECADAGPDDGGEELDEGPDVDDDGGAEADVEPDSDADGAETTPPACAAAGGFCSEARWILCPVHFEPVGGDGHLDCGSGGADGWCCVPAPPSECSDRGAGNCVPGTTCTGCWAPAPGTPACEAGRVCCIDVCD